MTDYTKTKIYKIDSHLGNKIYVGSTAKFYLSQRLQQHKNDYKCWKNGKRGKITSFELFDEYGPENCRIVLIEEYSCSSKDAKNAREGYYIKELDCVNKLITGRSIEESQKAYHQSEKGKVRTKKYLESDKGKEAIKKYTQSDKGKEKLKEAQKNYYHRKKAEKLEQEEQSEPIII